MLDRLIFIALILLYGILLGGTFCNLTCGPLLILRLAGQGRGAREGFILACIFSIPRIIILTVLGVILGYIGGSWADVFKGEEINIIRPVLYIIISMIMIFTGIRFLSPPGRSCDGDTGRFRRRLMDAAFRIGPGAGSSERIKLFMIGIIVSLMCLSQGVLASVTVSSALGVSANDAGWGAFWGGMGMLAFSLGLSIPLILLGTGASWFGKKIDTEDARKVGGLLLVIIGSLLAIYQLLSILNLLL